MAAERHKPSTFAIELAKQLSTRSRHVVLFLGAGASHAAGLPDMAGLKTAVLQALDENEKQHFDGRDVESGLSRLRRLASLISDGEQIAGYTAEQLRTIDAKVCKAIVEALSVPAREDSYDELGSWVAGADYRDPVEIVTVNYDVLVETALDRRGTPYFDGFVGNISGRFREDLIEPGSGIPSLFARLWKLHGSVNWKYEIEGDIRRVVRIGALFASDAAAIYPSDEKYDESRRVPFVVLMDRFRRALGESEALALFCGYSYRDQHLNEIIYDAAARHSRNHYVCLVYGDISNELVTRAEKLTNLTILGRTEYISAGVRSQYEPDDGVVAHVWDGTHCLLPDFAHLASFLRGSEALATARQS